MVSAAELIEVQTSEQQGSDGFKRVPLHDEDIGGHLLPILSKGLYTYPLHAIREYVQNSIDAEATSVTIKITGNSVIIHDDGHGMDYAELVAARRVGVSAKSIEWNVGFRGIGIYSAFDLCDRLLITTKRAGEEQANVLEFDFGEMKRRLAPSEQTGRRPALPLASLLYEHSYFSQEPDVVDHHYTIVQLEEISPVHLRQLDDRTALRAYILRNLPIDFAEDFPYRDQINQKLREEVPGFHAIRVVLESDDQPREVVERPTMPDLAVPKMEPIKNADGKKIAFYWACLRKPTDAEASRGRIPLAFADYCGFVYKIKGFTIGDNRRLQREFRKGNAGLYWWYTGEVYATDPDVIPNTARDDFETNLAQRALERAVRDALKELEGFAADYQEESRALHVFKRWDASVEALERDINDNSFNVLDAYSQLDDAIRELKAQKGKLANDQKAWGQDLTKKVEKLKAVVARAIDHPQPTAQQRKEATKRRAASDETGQRADTARSRSDAPIETLMQVIERLGWEVSQDSLPLIETIDRSLSDVLGSTSVAYRSVVANVEAALALELAR